MDNSWTIHGQLMDNSWTTNGQQNGKMLIKAAINHEAKNPRNAVFTGVYGTLREIKSKRQINRIWS